MLAALLLLSALTPVNEDAIARLISAHRGKVVLVNFWATWCEPCRAEMPQLRILQEKLAPKGVKVVLISADEPEQAQEAARLLDKNRIAPPHYRKQTDKDEAFINAMDPKWSGALPALFLYDRNGKKVRSFIGETPMSTVEAAIKKLL